MPTFLSEDWVEALDRAATAGDRTGDLAGVGPLVIEQVVHDPTSNRTVTYHLAWRDGALRVRSGPAASPDVTFTVDYATAREINTGATSAQAAFMTGRLRIGGDAMALVRWQPALAALGDVFAAVRSSTEY